MQSAAFTAVDSARPRGTRHCTAPCRTVLPTSRGPIYARGAGAGCARRTPWLLTNSAADAIVPYAAANAEVASL
jgi:hypothetical protein